VWCQDNNLSLNANKTKKLIVVYRIQKKEGNSLASTVGRYRG
jgi:hypothetical protein